MARRLFIAAACVGALLGCDTRAIVFEAPAQRFDEEPVAAPGLRLSAGPANARALRPGHHPAPLPIVVACEAPAVLIAAPGHQSTRIEPGRHCDEAALHVELVPIGAPPAPPPVVEPTPVVASRSARGGRRVRRRARRPQPTPVSRPVAEVVEPPSPAPVITSAPAVLRARPRPRFRTLGPLDLGDPSRLTRLRAVPSTPSRTRSEP